MHINRCNNGIWLLFIVLAGATASIANAAPATIPNTFIAGQSAVAAEVNANFDAVKIAVDDNDSRVTVNAADLASLVTTVNALQARINTLETDNAALQNFIGNVVPYMTGGTDAQGQPAVFFSGANVHVNNGDGSTATVNGTGNLIVGIDHNYTQFGGFIAGSRNSAVGAYSSVSGGERNLARGNRSSVSGGVENTASGFRSSVSGGSSNEASGEVSSVSGGGFNTASGDLSSVSGGQVNDASGDISSVSGGANRDVSGADDWRAGTLIENN